MIIPAGANSKPRGGAGGNLGTTATTEVYFEADDPSDVDFAGVSLSGMSPYMDVRELFE